MFTAAYQRNNGSVLRYGSNEVEIRVLYRDLGRLQLKCDGTR